MRKKRKYVKADIMIRLVRMSKLIMTSGEGEKQSVPVTNEQGDPEEEVLAKPSFSL